MTTTSIAELRAHLSEYLSSVKNEDIQITNRGEVVAVLMSPTQAKYAALHRLEGCLAGIEVDEKAIKEERLSKI